MQRVPAGVGAPAYIVGPVCVTEQTCRRSGVIITRVHDAKDPGEAAAKCSRAMKEGKVRTIGGLDVSVGADTICVHSDTPNAQAIAAAVRVLVPRSSN